MIKNINKSLILILAVFNLFSFVSCSKSDKNNTFSKSAEIKFSWWGISTRSEYTKLGLKTFKSLHNEIKVDPEAYLWAGYEDMFDNQFRAGTTADVIQINYNWLSKYSPDGEGFYDLNNLVDIIDLTNFTSDDLEYGVIDGKLNAIPIGFNTIVPIYNIDLLYQYGFDDIPYSWDDLLKIGRTMKKDGYYVLGGASKLAFLFTIACYEQHYDKKVFKNNHLNLNQIEVEDLLLIYKRFVDNHVLYPCDKYDRERFRNEKLMDGVVCWSNEVSGYALDINRKGFDYKLGVLPEKEFAKESGMYVKPSMMYAIKKDTKYPEACGYLVDFLLNNEKMAILQESDRGVPVSNSSFATLMESGHLNSLEYEASIQTRYNISSTNKMMAIMEDTKIVTGFSAYANAIVQGTISSQEAAAAFVKIIESVKY